MHPAENVSGAESTAQSDPQGANDSAAPSDPESANGSGAQHDAQSAESSGEENDPQSGNVSGTGSAPQTSDDSAVAEPDPPLAPTEITDPVRYQIAQMSLEEKVAQLFAIEPGDLLYQDGVRYASEELLADLSAYPVGGMIFFEENLQSPEQTKDLLSAVAETVEDAVGIPVFLGLDEEGGPVARISGREAFGIWDVRSQAENGATGDPANAEETGRQIGTYLRELGFNLDLAPVADLAYPGGNPSVARRSFGSDPEMVGEMIAAEIEGFSGTGVVPVMKHFPGLGFVPADTHNGRSYSWRHREDIEEELLPFRAGIDAGGQMIMAGHQGYPNITPDAEPASLSHYFLTELLREEMGFKGVIITDSLGMGAVQAGYTSAEACVAALQAGADMLLMPADFYAGYEGVLQAVREGTISEERIDESVYRILTVKQSIGAEDAE